MQDTTLNWELVETIEPAFLPDNEIHLWWADLNMPLAMVSGFEHLLTEKQQVKYQRLQSEESRCRYITSRVYLKKLLSAYTGQGDVELVYNSHGKPSVAGDDVSLSFNYSDTMGQGVFCFAKKQALGIDIESVNRKGNFRRITQRRFSKQEQDYLSTFDNEDAFSKEFIKCWTRKEAFGKAIGVGLHYPMREHSFAEVDLPIDVNGDDEDFLEKFIYINKEDDSEWLFQQFNRKQGAEEFVFCLVNSEHKANKLIARQFVGLDALNN